MKFRRWAALICLLSTAPSVMTAQNEAESVVSESTGPAAGLPAGQDTIDTHIDRALDFYRQGLDSFKEGKNRAARKRLDKAFASVASLLDNEEYAQRLWPDFEAFIEKMRPPEMDEEGLARSTGAASALDISDEEFSAAAALEAPAALNGNKYVIKIDPENNIAQKYLALYTKESRRKIVQGALERSGRYRDMITDALKKLGLPRELFYLVMVESEYKISGLSRVGAAGLWQLMPATGRKLGLKVNYWLDERFDPEKSTQAALKYLKELYELFDDWHLALAAYNRGEHGIARDLQFSKAADFFELSQREALPGETDHFVPKFMACVLLGENPKAYGYGPQYESPEPFDVVSIDKPLDLNIAAECAGTDESVIKRLNPGIKAWCTPPNYTGFALKIPAGTKTSFLEKLGQVKAWNPSRGFIRYRVKKGDALSIIARRFGSSVDTLMRDNKLANSRRLRVGHTIIIRPGRKFLGKN